ncbi:MAG: hypothetical protein M1357_03160 [Candidatus Marsarchaeota archaeon]|nr:hypothetical protein [Candidatus Marsarchaeota archaeon]
MAGAPKRETVVLAACGIGLGHVGRLMPIARILLSKGYNTIFTTYGDAANMCSKAGFLTYREEVLSYGSKEDGSLSLKETFRQTPKAVKAFLSQIRSELNVLRTHRPRVVVSDSRLSTLVAARILGVKSVLVIHELKVVLPIDEKQAPGLRAVKKIVERIALEVLGLGWDLATVVLITDYPPPYTVCKDSVVLPEFLRHKAKFIGTVSAPIPEISKVEAKRTLGLPADKPLIYFGLSGLPWERRLMAAKMMRCAQAVSRKGYTVLFSRGEPGGLPRLSEENGVKVCDWLSDRRVAYKAADVFVSVGGQTSVGEAIRYGVPMVVVPTPNHTEHDQIGDSLNELGIGLKISYRQLTSEGMVEAVSKITGNHFAERSSLIASSVSGYQAADMVTKTVEELLRD